MVELSKAKWHDHIRFVFSSLLLAFSLLVTCYAIVKQHTYFWNAVPGWAALIIFIVDLFLLGIVEGLQIALVELKRQHPDSYKHTYPAAYKLGQVALAGENVERFLMGRQVCVVFLVFMSAKLTTLTLEEGEEFLFPVPRWVVSVFFETGLLACIVVVIFAQLMPQIAAAQFPVHFMAILIMKPAYYFCIFLELTGITHACWLLSGLMAKAFGMKDDETTKNPNELVVPDDIIREVEASLDTVITNYNTSSNGRGEEIVLSVTSFESENGATAAAPATSGTVEEKPASGSSQLSQFTTLVEKVSETVNPEALRVVKHYLDTHPEKFHQFPYLVGNKMYTSPGQLARQLQEDGHEVPKFLTDISDPEHVPPHIVAFELMDRNKALVEEINFLKAKLKCT